MTDSSIPIRLAGTAVLLRDSAEGLETLLLRRNAKLAFAGGAWVFPGGAIDASELEAASTEEQAARTATVREVHEECGLTIAENSLVHFCNWTTPIGEKRRFATWFFAAQADQDSEDGFRVPTVSAGSPISKIALNRLATATRLLCQIFTQA